MIYPNGFGILKDTPVTCVQGIPLKVDETFIQQDVGCCLHDGVKYMMRPQRMHWRWTDLFYVVRVDGEDIKLAPEQPVLTVDGPVRAFQLREDMRVITPGDSRPAIVEFCYVETLAAPVFWFSFNAQELLAVKTICLLQPAVC